ncbi:MAG TPA: type IV pilin protein [Cellvibrio sp.]|nr:type IV pilin protein [Cellvibrio sp.]
MISKPAGFTLIEVLITVAIVGVLAGIVYPSYLDMVRKSNRSDAKVALSDVAQRMQRCFTAHSTYKPAAGTCEVVDKVTSTGITSPEGFYTISLAAGDHAQAKYVLKATPVASKRQASDSKCTSFTLDQAGVKKAYTNSTPSTENCW